MKGAASFRRMLGGPPRPNFFKRARPAALVNDREDFNAFDTGTIKNAVRGLENFPHICAHFRNDPPDVRKRHQLPRPLPNASSHDLRVDR